MPGKFSLTGCALFLCAAALLPLPAAAQDTNNTSKYPTDDNKYDGDHLRFKTIVRGFDDSYASADADKDKDKKNKCAPPDSQLEVKAERQDKKLLVRFRVVPHESDYKKDNDESRTMLKALADCAEKDRVNTYTSYVVDKNLLTGSSVFRRAGVVFGGLVVPFKLRLGGDRGVASSSTVAPFIGYRLPYDFWGMTFQPIFAAGLGLVPVSDPSTGKTDTKTAFSFSFGVISASSKNDKFLSGFVVGRDVLSKSDRDLDPNVNKWWMSFYAGTAF